MLVKDCFKIIFNPAVRDSHYISDKRIPLCKRPLNIAHRGASGYLPEHTLEAYQLAIDMGADYIEQDVVITRDGVLVVRHENEIGGTTDVADKFPERKTTKIVDGQTIQGWFVEDFTLQELKTLRARKRVPNRSQQYNGLFQIPTLEEVIQLGLKNGVGLYPELKHPTYFRNIGLPLEDRLLQLLDKYNLNQKSSPIIIQSFEPTVLQYIRSKSPVKITQLIEDLSDPLVPIPYDFIEKNIPITYKDLSSIQGLEYIKFYADIVGPYKNDIRNNQGFVDIAHKLGLDVHSWTFRADTQWTCQEQIGCEAYQPFSSFEEEIKWFRDLGIDGYFTDFPDIVKNTLNTSC